MRKCLFSVLVVLVAATAVFAADLIWYRTDQTTVGWDPVVTLENGTGIPSGSIVQYRVFRIDAADPDKSGAVDISPDLDGDGTPNAFPETQLTVTLTGDGRSILGVRAERWANGECVEESEISWSDNPLAVKDSLPFGVEHFIGVLAPSGLRREAK